MKQNTIVLKIAIIIIALPIIVLCAGFMPLEIYHGWERSSAIDFYLFSIIYAAAIPFFVALSQAFKLLIYIDQNKAFSTLSVKALKTIKYCAIAISVLYMALSPALYILVQREGSPGLLLFAGIIIFVSFMIATFAAVLEKLLAQAIAIKS